MNMDPQNSAEAGKKTEKKVKKEYEKRNKEINKLLAHDKKQLDREVKVLLLGSGESGKSTVAKQMKILHLNGFTDEEKRYFKNVILNGVVNNMKELIEITRAKYGQDVKSENKAAAGRILSSEGDKVSQALAADLKVIWADPQIQATFEKRNEYYLPDSVDYFLDQIDRVAADNYSPNEQDILRSRVKTTGVHEVTFTMEDTFFRVIDVGGQKSERKKWIHCFEDVTTVLFCASLSDYDMQMYEDVQTNRMHDSLALFDEICNSKWFTDTPIILFLNKRDLFQQKIKKTDLRACFPDYTGGTNFDAGIEFIKAKFLAKNQNPKKHVYVHITVATDTSNILMVWNAVKDIVLTAVLKDAGMVTF